MRTTNGKQEQAVKIISYYRVSTQKQGRSGLGLEGQQAAVEQFAKSNQADIIASYKEIESGRRADRPELQRALAHARRAKAVLVVAKLDRLSRQVSFLAALMESKVDFVCCDNPHATKFSIHILAAVAEFERTMISDRTRTALQQARVRGVKLGSARPGHWKGHEAARLVGGRKGAIVAGTVNRKTAVDAYSDLAPSIKAARENGQTLQQIAAQLNLEGHTTRNGSQWHPVQVARVLARI